MGLCTNHCGISVGLCASQSNNPYVSVRVALTLDSPAYEFLSGHQQDMHLTAHELFVVIRPRSESETIVLHTITCKSCISSETYIYRFFAIYQRPVTSLVHSNVLIIFICLSDVDATTVFPLEGQDYFSRINSESRLPILLTFAPVI